MVVYAAYEIPAEAFVVGSAFTRLPGVRVELDRLVPTADRIVPYVWVEGATPSAVLDAAREEGAVEDITVVSENLHDGALFRVVWRRSFRDAAVAIAETDAVLLSGVGDDDAWTFEFRGDDRRALAEVQAFFGANDVPFTLTRLTGAPGEGRTGPLTAAQHEALELAHRHGYFDEPRGVTVAELATELGITRQAASGRLRRAIDTLVEGYLHADPAESLTPAQ